ncbi:guanine deaminase [Phlebotomus argentipes]|uniref:guanine deaminase n=1 Tax=Phlebotomus argentipes TaxID=94469 RepID=UPI002892AA0C|nr:guanine deaminase [Phlebotomus argentipes]
MGYLFIGQIVHSKSFDEIEFITDGFLAVDEGKVVGIGDISELPTWRQKQWSYEEIQLSRNQFILPGFVDCHIHAPQMPNNGLGLDMELLDWLKTYTFPMESQYKDCAFASYVYDKVVKRTLSLGTTCASYFATNHRAGTLILANHIHKQGQRALVGKVSANQSSVDYYKETTEESIKENKAFIQDIMKLNSDLINVTITPRFALSCDEYLMKELGKLAKEHNLNIQTHISENLGEVAEVKRVYNASNYASVYDSANLLTSKCILAHGVHLEDEELELLQKRGTSIAHCPSSNTNLKSGLCDIIRLRQAGISVGLGTDISGGSDVSILAVIRDAMGVSQHLDFAKKQDIKGTGRVRPETDEQKKVNQDYVPLNYKQALFLATLGGAEALNLAHKIGNFQVGKEFDALLIDIDVDPVDVYEPNISGIKNKPENLQERVQKFVYAGDDRNISRVFVKGRQVK